MSIHKQNWWKHDINQGHFSWKQMCHYLWHGKWSGNLIWINAFWHGMNCHWILALFSDWWVKSELCLCVLGSPEKTSERLSVPVRGDHKWRNMGLWLKPKINQQSSQWRGHQLRVQKGSDRFVPVRRAWPPTGIYSFSPPECVFQHSWNCTSQIWSMGVNHEPVFLFIFSVAYMRRCMARTSWEMDHRRFGAPSQSCFCFLWYTYVCA